MLLMIPIHTGRDHLTRMLAAQIRPPVDARLITQIRTAMALQQHRRAMLSQKAIKARHRLRRTSLTIICSRSILINIITLTIIIRIILGQTPLRTLAMLRRTRHHQVILGMAILCRVRSVTTIGPRRSRRIAQCPLHMQTLLQPHLIRLQNPISTSIMIAMQHLCKPADRARLRLLPRLRRRSSTQPAACTTVLQAVIALAHLLSIET